MTDANTRVVTDKSTVILHYDLTLEDGTAADSTRVNNKPAKMVLGDGSLTANFESCLKGLKIGDKKKFTLPPDDVFGMPNPDNIYHVDRSKFGADIELKEGVIVGFTQPDGSDLPGIIRTVAGHSVTVDFNHPLAGETLIFNVEVIDILDTNN